MKQHSIEAFEPTGSYFDSVPSGQYLLNTLALAIMFAGFIFAMIPGSGWVFFVCALFALAVWYTGCWFAKHHEMYGLSRNRRDVWRDYKALPQDIKDNVGLTLDVVRAAPAPEFDVYDRDNLYYKVRDLGYLVEQRREAEAKRINDEKAQNPALVDVKGKMGALIK